MTVAVLSFRGLDFIMSLSRLAFHVNQLCFTSVYVNHNPVLRPLGGKTLPKKFEMRLNEHILANGVDIKKQEEMNCFSLITE